MNYFKNAQNKVFAYDDSQVSQGYGSDMTPITTDEVAVLTAPPPPTTEELIAQAEANRQAAYIAEADPLFFKAQRGEATLQEWQDKVAEIKARYPKETE